MNVDPRLGPLANNGGDTFTHVLWSGSPAIDQGSCRDAATDQRGQPRPVDISSIPNADDGCDIGAYEQQQQFQVYLPLLLKNAAITRSR
jgi:hypothetical protein